MNQLTQSKNTIIPPVLIALTVACFAISPMAQAVNPTPGGCYPGYTTAEGCNTRQSLTSGLGNTGVGWYSLFDNSIGSYFCCLKVRKKEAEL